MTREDLVKVIHQAFRAYNEAIGGTPLADWEHAEPWQREVGVKMICFLVRNADYVVTPRVLHEMWRSDMAAHGWTCGEKKCTDAKTHPNMIAWDRLSSAEQAKTKLYFGIWQALRDQLDDEDDSGGEEGAGYHPAPCPQRAGDGSPGMNFSGASVTIYQYM